MRGSQYEKNFFLLIAASYLLLGCSNNGNGFSLMTYDNNQLESNLEKEGIEPKLPTEFPIAITEYEILEPHTKQLDMRQT